MEPEEQKLRNPRLMYSSRHMRRLVKQQSNIYKQRLKNSTSQESTPLNNIDEILALEKELVAEDLSLHLMNKFKKLGGSNFKNLVRRCMKVSFTNQLGMQVSWTGQKDNFRMSDLKLMGIMKRAAQSTFKNSTDRDFELVVAEWLRFSKQRLNREK